MKTLDEVIIGIKEQMGLGDPILIDALQYLKQYKELADDSEAFAEWRENPPLTWDELKTMEGKPIFVKQHHGDTKGWLLILRKCDDVVTCTTKYGNWFYLCKASYGDKLQAYRKEKYE